MSIERKSDATAAALARWKFPLRLWWFLIGLAVGLAASMHPAIRYRFESHHSHGYTIIIRHDRTTGETMQRILPSATWQRVSWFGDYSESIAATRWPEAFLDD